MRHHDVALEHTGGMDLERRSPVRMVLVAVEVAALGAAGGAVAGMLSATTWLLLFQRAWLGVLPSVLVDVALLGAAFGAVLMPLAGFTALRRIPLWKILVTAITGTAIGGIVGAQFLNQVLLGPVVGFVAAVAWLAVRARRGVHAGRG